MGTSALVAIFNNLISGYGPPIQGGFTSDRSLFLRGSDLFVQLCMVDPLRKQTVVDDEAVSIEVLDPASQEGHM